jgi:hypothetical protein
MEQMLLEMLISVSWDVLWRPLQVPDSPDVVSNLLLNLLGQRVLAHAKVT